MHLQHFLLFASKCRVRENLKTSFFHFFTGFSGTIKPHGVWFDRSGKASEKMKEGSFQILTYAAFAGKKQEMLKVHELQKLIGLEELLPDDRAALEYEPEYVTRSEWFVLHVL